MNLLKGELRDDFEWRSQSVERPKDRKVVIKTIKFSEGTWQVSLILYISEYRQLIFMYLSYNNNKKTAPH